MCASLNVREVFLGASHKLFYLFFFNKKGRIQLVQNVCISKKKERMVATRSGVAVGLKKAVRKKISVNK